MKVKIIFNKDGNYELENCPLGFKMPLACQGKGCKYWNGYLFENAYYNGFKHYISSHWRKYMFNKAKCANYVRCLKED